MMHVVRGDIWDFHPTDWIVIPTNVGWAKNGANVMGAGLAKDAAMRYPELPCWYGFHCRVFDGQPEVMAYYQRSLLLVPTKPLNRLSPAISWKSKSNVPFVDEALSRLVKFAETSAMFVDRTIYVPLLGVGNGGLHEASMRQLLSNHLRPSCRSFCLVERE